MNSLIVTGPAVAVNMAGVPQATFIHSILLKPSVVPVEVKPPRVLGSQSVEGLIEHKPMKMLTAPK